MIWRLPFLVLAIMALLVIAAVAAVATLTVTTVTTTMTASVETVEEDAGTEVTSLGVKKAGGNVDASGITCLTAVEANEAMQQAGVDIVKNYWRYDTVVREKVAGDWAVGNYYRINVYADGLLMGTVYTKQTTNQSGSEPEGVKVAINLGITGAFPVLPDSYTVQAISLGATCT